MISGRHAYLHRRSAASVRPMHDFPHARTYVRTTTPSRPLKVHFFAGILQVAVLDTG